jgi:hypothetical protein
MRSQLTIQTQVADSHYFRKGNHLLTKTGLHSNAFATLGATPRDDRATSFGLHARTKAVRLRSVTPVGLECALGHGKIPAPQFDKQRKGKQEV